MYLLIALFLLELNIDLYSLKYNMIGVHRFVSSTLHEVCLKSIKTVFA